MQLVQLKILKTIVSSQYGALSYGDVLRCGAAYAKHLVEDLAAAKYLTAQPASSQPAAPRKRRGKPSKEKS